MHTPNRSNLNPRAEPVAWGVIVAAVLAALGSYGFGITPEMKELLILVAPFVIAAIVTRFRVYAPDTVEKIANQQYAAGTPPTEPQPEIPSPAVA
jgi:hypothetical protein